jgi:hypothetical protein
VKFSDLSPEERGEIDTLVHDSYVEPGGRVRTHAEAHGYFSMLVSQAVQAHRDWAEQLLDQWREDGERAFMQSRWKSLRSYFEFQQEGKKRTRTVNRGILRTGDDGGAHYVQDALWDATADELRQMIKEARMQIAEHQANIALYQDMLDLIQVHEVFTFREALEAESLTWGEFLDRRAS